MQIKAWEEPEDSDTQLERDSDSEKKSFVRFKKLETVDRGDRGFLQRVLVATLQLF